MTIQSKPEQTEAQRAAVKAQLKFDRERAEAYARMARHAAEINRLRFAGEDW